METIRKSVETIRKFVTPQAAGEAIAQLMPRVIQGIQLEFFVKRGVTQTQFVVMLALHGYGRCTMGALAKNMHVRMPTATGVVSRLVSAGYVRRQAKPEDRRQVLVSLTPKGQAFIHAFQGVVRHRWEEILRSLRPPELATFHTVITKLHSELKP